jgi:hypothetical protein
MIIIELRNILENKMIIQPLEVILVAFVQMKPNYEVANIYKTKFRENCMGIAWKLHEIFMLNMVKC